MLQVSAMAELIDHGAPVPLAENRGVVATTDKNGHHLVIACSMDLSPRGWVLITDIDTGKTEQLRLPEQAGNSPTYGVLLSSRGRFYTTSGPWILELDIEQRQWTACVKPADIPLYLCFTEGRDGTIYAGGYAGCNVAALNPDTHEAIDLGPMDPSQSYLSFLGTDDQGWLYCGIGVARHNLVAYSLKTKEHRQLAEEADRKTGTCTVATGADGKAYGNIAGTTYRLYGGEKTPIPNADVPADSTGRMGWGGTLNRLADGRTISAYSMDGKWLNVHDPKADTDKRIAFDYESVGAYIRFVNTGPGGKVWGSSGHPPWAFTFDPKSGKTDILGHSASWQATDWSGDKVYSSEYSGGYLSVFDVTRPWTGEAEGADANPRILGRYAPDINQPYATLVHPDKRHVLISGWPGYGCVGGGLAIYDTETGQTQLIKHTDLAPDQSTYALAALPNGDIVAGSNISGGHGTHPVAKEGTLYLLDWQTKTVAYRTVPVPNSPGVDDVAVADDGLVYAMAEPATFFVFDPQKKQVIHTQDLQEYGGLPYHAMTKGPDGKLYLAMTKALLRLTPGTNQVEKLADAPPGVSAGAAVVAGRLYFVAGVRMWSVGI